MGKMEKDEREMICDEGMTMRKEQMTGQTPWKCVGNVQALQVSSERRDEIDAAAPDYFWMEQDDSGKESGISNWGMKKGIRFEKGRTYRFSCYAKGETMYSKIYVALRDKNMQILDRAEFYPSQEWKKEEFLFHPSETVEDGCLTLTITEQPWVAFKGVSLLPGYYIKKSGMRERSRRALK